MSRINLKDSLRDIVISMSEGNPGALRVCMEIVSSSRSIDPDSALGEFGPLIFLDSLGIYGPSIWMLYKDVCGEDVTKLLAVLRAAQLGIISNSTVMEALSSYGNGLDADEVLEKVRESLPNFGQ